MKTEIIGLQAQQAAHKQAPSGQPGRTRKGADPVQLYAKLVERYAMLFDRPEARLRFLNNTLAKQRERQVQLQQSLRHLRFLENTRVYDWIVEARCYSAILEELKALSPTLPPSKQRFIAQLQVPFSARFLFFAHQSRHAFYALGVVAAGLLLFSLYSFASWSARHVNTYLAQRYRTANRAPIIVSTTGQGNDAFSATSAKYLPGYQPEKVWLVERTSEFERYSNGCRILTKHEMENHPRGYYLIPRGSDQEGTELRRDIVGIVYHTSESDIVPFTPANNDSIQRRSLGLLDWIRKNKSYNYLIDRYGEIYRVVRDDHAAYHAGNSIWADDQYAYVGLNESFLGICFESTVSAGSLHETLTEAQIVAGRTLTNVLRSKYGIDDANCTTHGLVSVNPDRMLIAFHHDWVRNFPFEAMGLSDKYKVQPPNMSDYGFTYDEDVLQKLENKLWPGAIAADEEFNKRVEKMRSNTDVVRRKLRDRYLSQLNKVRHLHAEPTSGDRTNLTAQSSVANGAAESGNN